MKERASVLSLLFCFLFSLAFFAFSAAAMTPPLQIVTTTGNLKDLEQITEDGYKAWVLTLEVDGEEYSGTLGKDCPLYSEAGKNLSPGDFLKIYKDRIITVDFIENTDIIVECRVGSN